MKNKFYKITLIFALSISCFAQVKNADISLKTEINQGAELFTIMLWISGKYPIPMDSNYKSEVWKHFSKYRQHPALARIKNTEIYPDFTEMGLLLTNFPEIKIEIPEKNIWYEKKGGKEHIADILNDAKIFAKAANFWKFWQKHKNEYSRLETDFANDLKAKEVLSSVDSFFRYGETRPRPQVTIYLEPLNNWGAHAIDFEKLRNEPNGNRITFQIGPTEQDEQLPDSPLAFKTNRSTIQNVWHEASHIYLRKTLSDNKERIAKLARLFDAPALASQNVKTWDYAFEENLVRAIVATIIKQKFGEDAYKREILSQTQRGFVLTKDISEIILAEYKVSFANFDDFTPKVLSLLERK